MSAGYPFGLASFAALPTCVQDSFGTVRLAVAMLVYDGLNVNRLFATRSGIEVLSSNSWYANLPAWSIAPHPFMPLRSLGRVGKCMQLLL